MALTVIATLHAQQGKQEALLEAVSEAATEIHRAPGCLKYAPHVSGRSRVVVVESWADRDALNTHAQSPAFTVLSERFEELLSRPPEIVFATPAPAGNPPRGTL